MQSYQVDDLVITLNREGAREYSKVSFPIRYGRYSEIQTSDYLFQFNLNGEIKHIQGRSQNWPHPEEWLKRTVGNDWIYYSAGDYKGVYELFGEYYFPCLSHPSNSIINDDPFEKNTVTSAIRSWQSLQGKMREINTKGMHRVLKDFLSRVASHDEEVLRERSEKLHCLIRGPVTVLPPDSRHVDYEVIPLVVAVGCLYDCGFCRVKSGRGFAPLTSADMVEQIEGVKGLYGRDLQNYNSIFLGEHDALCAGIEILEFAALTAHKTFDFEHSYMKENRLFLFGSVDSLIHSKETLFDMLNSLPFYTYVNVGLESADLATLAALKKPVDVERVREAFSRMLEINATYERIEVTANFVYGDDLPSNHLPSFLKLVKGGRGHFHNKGTLYLSPLIQRENRKRGSNRELLRRFYKIKGQSPLPTYLYLIQRL